MNTQDVHIIPLSPDVDRAAFDCGIPTMNDYLLRYAGQNEENHLARTRIALDRTTGRIVGYYTTSFAQVSFEHIPARGLPKRYPFTVGLLAQIAIDQRYQGQGWGKLLLFEALARFEQADGISAIPAVVLDLREPRLRAYYARFGFVNCGDTAPERMYLLMKTIAKMGLNPPR